MSEENKNCGERILHLSHRYARPDLLVIEVRGDIDTYTTEKEFFPYVSPLVTNEVFYVVLDFSQARYIDSVGMASLITLYKQLSKRRGKMVIVTQVPLILRLFSLTAIDRLVPIFPSLAEALEHCPANPA